MDLGHFAIPSNTLPTSASVDLDQSRVPSSLPAHFDVVRRLRNRPHAARKGISCLGPDSGAAFPTVSYDQLEKIP